MFLTHPDNWQMCLTHNLLGFDKEYAYTVEHFIRPRDQAIIYLAEESSIWGVVEVTDVLLTQTELIGWLKKGWEARKSGRIQGVLPARVRFQAVCQVNPARKIGGKENASRNELESSLIRRGGTSSQIALFQSSGGQC
jgi:hypothetical protein